MALAFWPAVPAGAMGLATFQSRCVPGPDNLIDPHHCSEEERICGAFLCRLRSRMNFARCRALCEQAQEKQFPRHLDDGCDVLVNHAYNTCLVFCQEL